MTHASVSRRWVLRAAGAALGTGALSACGTTLRSAGDGPSASSTPSPVPSPTRTSGAGPSATYTAVEGPVDLGGPTPTTWSYDGVVPGRALRVTAGDTVDVALVNRLPVDTSVHWHGLAVPQGMDGVPHVTQAGVRPGETYRYRFVAETPGTYWFHPHVGTQLDRGLSAPLIVADPHEPGDYAEDWVVVLDDWVDGVSGTPDDVLARLRAAGHGMGGMGGMGMGGSPTGTLLGGHGGDVIYPHYLLNGRVPASPVTLSARPGTRVRLRILNAGADTAFRVALGGHRLTVTHTDGWPVQPVEADALLIGMGERYDAIVTLGDGVFPLVAAAEGKAGAARGIVRTGTGTAPPGDLRPAELDRYVLRHRDLRSVPSALLDDRAVDVEHEVRLTGGMMTYEWGINGRPYDPARAFRVQAGDRLRLRLTNDTMMWHPVHVHGHTFQVPGAAGAGLRKDTVIVVPGQTVDALLQADNPGDWMVHCHNAYHAEAGMMAMLSYA